MAILCGSTHTDADERRAFDTMKRNLQLRSERVTDNTIVNNDDDTTSAALTNISMPILVLSKAPIQSEMKTGQFFRRFGLIIGSDSCF